MTKKSENAIRLERLEILADMLLNHDKIFKRRKVRLDLRGWYSKNDCGTAACAIGSAALYKPFIKQGLMLRKDKIGDSLCGCPVYIPNKEFKELYLAGWIAVQQFFGITQIEAEYCFHMECYTFNNAEALEVARRVTKLINQYKTKGE